MTDVTILLAPVKARHSNAAARLMSGYTDVKDGLEAIDDRSRLLTAIEAVVKVHEPIDAALYARTQQRKVQVCTCCGTDDGNWQRWPCPTITAVVAALGEDK